MLTNIDDIRIEDFILSLYKETDDEILYLKKEALLSNVPIIRDETRDIIKLLLNIKKPKSILEIGTAIGYSTTIIAKLCPDSKIITIEDFGRRYIEAKKNLEKYKNVELIKTDAGDYLIEIEKNKNMTFDFVFLDAAKAQYINWLPHIKSIMKKNAILIADNIFKDGEVIESKFLIKKRDRTIHKRMRDYLYTICNDTELNTQLFNLGDGIAVSIKI